MPNKIEVGHFSAYFSVFNKMGDLKLPIRVLFRIFAKHIHRPAGQDHEK